MKMNLIPLIDGARLAVQKHERLQRACEAYHAFQCTVSLDMLMHDHELYEQTRVESHRHRIGIAHDQRMLNNALDELRVALTGFGLSGAEPSAVVVDDIEPQAETIVHES